MPDDNAILPVGKLPPALLAEIIGNAPVADHRVFLKAGVGLDCAVVAVGGRLGIGRRGRNVLELAEFSHRNFLGCELTV